MKRADKSLIALYQKAYYGLYSQSLQAFYAIDSCNYSLARDYLLNGMLDSEQIFKDYICNEPDAIFEPPEAEAQEIAETCKALSVQNKQHVFDLAKILIYSQEESSSSMSSKKDSIKDSRSSQSTQP